MEHSRTIHIINLNHYLENNKLAQHLLEVNKSMEPNMNFRIWTEDDPEIQEGIKSCNYNLANNSTMQMAGIYLPNYILYLYGGVYCEMDYEFLQKDFFYNLSKSNDTIISSYIFKNFTISNGSICYVPYPKDMILKNNLKLLNTPIDDNNKLYCEIDYLSFNRALDLGLYNQNELTQFTNTSNKFDFYSNPNILHFCNLGQTKVIYVCNDKKYLELYKIQPFCDLFKNKTIVYYSPGSPYISKVWNNDDIIDWYRQQPVRNINNSIKHYIDTVRTYTDKKVIVLTTDF